mgnify:FL=1
MARFTRTRNLEVHHIRRGGGNGLDNAEVLCSDCHAKTSTYGTSGKSPDPFSQDTKDRALKRAGYQCECTRSLCSHH